jgi:hypothetical protein
MQKRADLERVKEERRRIGFAELTGVTLGRELECLRRKRQVIQVGGSADCCGGAPDHGRGHVRSNPAQIAHVARPQVRYLRLMSDELL